MSFDNDLLPSNATAEERALALAAKFSDEVLPEDIKALWNPDSMPAAFFPFLAWGLHIDYWDDALPDETKRAILRRAFEWHRYKGTPWAVRRALEDLGFSDVAVSEWKDWGGAPYTFALTVRPFDEDIFNKAKRVAFEYKNARSHLTEIVGKMAVKEELTAEDEAVIRRSKILTDMYPWPENLYGSLDTPLKYLGATDKMAGHYDIYGTAELMTQTLRVCLIDYMFAQHRYGDPATPELYYDSGIVYGADAELTDSVVLYTAGSSEMMQEALSVEDRLGTVTKWIL